MSMIEDVNSFVKNHLPFLVLLSVVLILSAVTVVVSPRGPEVPKLENTYQLFGPSIAAFVLLMSIGSYLSYRYYVKTPPRSDTLYQLIWGVSFMIFSLTFLGLCLQALGFDFADMNQPAIFLVWRTPMIVWVAGMWIGTIQLFTENKLNIYLPAILILGLGLLWFVFGLLVQENIEQTMYGFLFAEFIPMAIILAYLWFVYTKDTELTSPRILVIGFSLLAITYAAWAPWHFTDLVYLYFVWFNLFIVSLGFIFAGFFALPKETTTRVVTEDDFG